MSVNWDDFTPIEAPQASGGDIDWSQFEPIEVEKSSVLRRAVGDTAISALKGAIAVPEAAVGLADIVSGGRAGKALEGLGYRPKEARAALDEVYSPEQQVANKAVSEAEGFTGTIKAAIENPSVIGHTVVESVPSMLAGGVIGRGVSAATKATPWVAAAVGEGVVGAGTAAERTRQKTEDGTLTPGQSAAAVASGIGTAAFGAAGGRLAQKLGIADVDTLLVSQGSNYTSKGVIRRIVEGGISEGVFEELPQSVQEQVWQNAALDRPLTEGVPQSAAMGLLTGAVMGGVASGAFRGKPSVADIGNANTVDEAIAAATAVVEAPVDVTPADSLIEAVNPYDVGGFVTRAQAGEETDFDTPQRGLFGGGGEVAAPELAQAAEADRQAASQAEFDEFLRKEQIDATYLRQAAIEAAQRARAFDLAEQQRREADIPAMQQQVADQRVEQAEAVTKSQGFDVAEPTAMQLAMERARQQRAAQQTARSQSAPIQTEEVADQGTPPIDTARANILQGQTTKTQVSRRESQASPVAIPAPEIARAIETGTTQPAQQVQSSASLATPESTNFAPIAAPSQPIVQPEITQPAPASQAAEPFVERRSDVTRRRAVAEMSPDEMRQALLTSEKTGIPNLRAFEERVQTNPQDKVLYGDLDDFKAMNTKLGHDGADQVLKAVGTVKAQIAARMGVNPYHRSGDEFLATGLDDATLNAYGKAVQDELAKTTFQITMPDGRVVEQNGVGFSYGTGQNTEFAETRANEQKAERKRLGLRAGQRDVVEAPERGGQDNEDNAVGRDGTPAESEVSDEQSTGEVRGAVEEDTEGQEASRAQDRAATPEEQAAAEVKRRRAEALIPVSKRSKKKGADESQDDKAATTTKGKDRAPNARSAEDGAGRESGQQSRDRDVSAAEEVKQEGDDKDPFTGTTLLHSGLSPIEAAKSIGKKLDEATKTKIPDWLKELPKETQDAAKKAGIYVEKKPLSDRLKELRNTAVKKAQQGIFDQFAPLMELGEREYVLARLSKSSDAPLESLLLYGKPFMNDAGAVDVRTEKGGLIAVLQQLQGEHDRFFAWIAGNRASKLKAQGRENLFTDSDISALKSLNQGKMQDGKSRAILYEAVRAQFNGYSKSVLDIAEKSGIINREDRSVWESDFYVPFYRVMEDEGIKGPKNVSGLVNQYAFKKLKGGTEDLNDLMQNTLRNWSHLLSASLKNQAAAAAVKTAEKAGIATPVSGKQKGAVTILEDGKEKHFAVDDPFIMDAITSLEWAGWNNPAMKWMTRAKHYLTLGVTISPTFKIRNLMRDQMAAVGLNPISYNIMNNLADGWKGTDKESEQYAKMLTGGGLMRFGTFLEDDRAEHAKRLIQDGVKASTILDSRSKVRAAVDSAIDWWQEVGDRSENITRAAIYKQRYEQSIKAGMSDDEAHLMASFAARDSMDFSLQGQWGSVRFLTQLVPFMNARLQGLYKLGRDGIMPSGRMLAPQIFGDRHEGDKAKAMRFGAVTGTVALASIALMLAYRDDDDWKNREEWDRDTYWFFKIGDTAYRIPKPFEIGAIGTIAERGLETILNGMDKESRKLFIERLGTMITQTFSMNPVPQLVKPWVDIYANTDSFTGRPIETQGMERLSKAERIGQNTSATAQALGKVTSLVGMSPVQIDFLVDAYFSWLGTHAVMIADFAVHPLMGLPDKPSRRWPDDYLVIGDFAKDLPARQSKYITKFYEQSKEVQQAMADIRYYQGLGNTVKARELMDENKDKVRMYQMYSHAGKQLADINKRIKIVQARKMDADAKRDEIDRLTQNKIRLTKIIEERRLQRQRQSQPQE